MHERQKRAMLALDGLSIGDAFGQQFFMPHIAASADRANLPVPSWHYTDDTEMALAIVEVLSECEEIDQDRLAQSFASRFEAEPGQGYGAGARLVVEHL